MTAQHTASTDTPTGGVLRVLTPEAVQRATEALASHPDHYAAALRQVERNARRHRDAEDVAALARVLVPSFVRRGMEDNRKAWTGAARRAVVRCAAVLAAAQDAEAIDPADVADDTRLTIWQTASPDPQDAYRITKGDRARVALDQLTGDHRDAMAAAARRILGGADALTSKETPRTEQRRISEARAWLIAHRSTIDRALLCDPRRLPWPATAAALARHAADAAQDATAWTPGRATGHRVTGPQPIGGARWTLTRPHIAATGERVTIPAERIRAALDRHAAYAATLAAQDAEPGRLAAKAQEARSRGLHRAARRLDRRAAMLRTLRREAGYAPWPEPTAERGTLAARTPAGTATTRPVQAWTADRSDPMPEPTNLADRLALVTAQVDREPGHTLAGRKPLPAAKRPPQVAAWQTPGGTARPLAAPTVAVRPVVDTGVPGTEVAVVTVTAPNGDLWTRRTLDHGHTATEATRPSPVTKEDRTALSAALATPAAPITTPAEYRTAPGYDRTSAALADRIAGRALPGPVKKPSSRKRPGSNTGPTVPAWF